MFYHSQFRAGDPQAIQHIHRKAARHRADKSGPGGSTEVGSLEAMQTLLDEMVERQNEQRARIQALEGQHRTTATEMAAIHQNSGRRNALIHELVQYLLNYSEVAGDSL